MSWRRLVMWGWLCRCLKPRSIATAHKPLCGWTLGHSLSKQQMCAWKTLETFCIVSLSFEEYRKRCSAWRFNAMLQYCVSDLAALWADADSSSAPHPWHAHPSGAQPIGQSCWQPRVAPPSKWNHQSLHYRASLCSPWWVISNFSSTFTSGTLETSLVDKISKTVVTVQMLLPGFCTLHVVLDIHNNGDYVTINTPYKGFEGLLCWTTWNISQTCGSHIWILRSSTTLTRKFVLTLNSWNIYI